MSKCGIIIAAAGFGLRYRAAGGKGQKLEQPLNGLPLFTSTLNHARESGLPVQVVTRPEYAGIRALCRQAGVPCRVIISRGLGETIAEGVRASATWQSWLIQPADMPFVPPEAYHQIAAALQQHLTARMVWQELPGHPVGFAAPLRERLLQLDGDDGAKALLRRHPPLLINSFHRGVIEDIDLPLNTTGNHPDAAS